MTVIAVAPAAAEPELLTATPADPNQFVETYDDTPAVSGTALVGLSLGSLAGDLDVSDVRVAAPSPGATALCVRVTTLDGRFSASNLYTVSPGAADAIRLSMVTRRFDRELARYRPESLAVRAYVAGEDCAPRNVLHVPQLQPVGGTAQLVVQVNSSTRRTVAHLAAPDGAVLHADCDTPPASALIAFDRICYLARPAGAAAGTYRLTVELDDGFGVETIAVDVFLPVAG